MEKPGREEAEGGEGVGVPLEDGRNGLPGEASDEELAEVELGESPDAGQLTQRTIRISQSTSSHLLHSQCNRTSMSRPSTVAEIDTKAIDPKINFKEVLWPLQEVVEAESDAGEAGKPGEDGAEALGGLPIPPVALLPTQLPTSKSPDSIPEREWEVGLPGN